MSRTLSAAVVLSVLATAACWTEGPVGFVPGGPFSGEPEHGPEPDWSFALDTDSVDIEIGSEPPRSVRTGIVVHEGLPYLPVTWSPLKRWPAVVRAEPKILLRVEGRLFERRASWIEEGPELETLRRVGQAKYGAPFHARWTHDFTFYFRLATGR